MIVAILGRWANLLLFLKIFAATWLGLSQKVQLLAKSLPLEYIFTHCSLKVHQAAEVPHHRSPPNGKEVKEIGVGLVKGK
jgi:hypothetical protein